MKSHASKLKQHHPEIKVALFSKKESAQFIASGTRHIHSTMLLFSDPSFALTKKKFLEPELEYPWEVMTEKEVIFASESTSKQSVIKHILTETEFSKQSQNKDRLNIVLEELLTNAFYHSKKDSSGNDLYPRTAEVYLEKNQEIRIEYGENSHGIYVSVLDHGGSLSFNDLAKRLGRFFSETNTKNSFDTKSSGAGLGLSMVYQVATHFLIEVKKGCSTKVALWLTKSRYFDQDSFSFNFFEE